MSGGLNLFISHGRIVSTAGRSSPERVWDAHKDGAFEGFPMAILVNHYSASASEIVAACLQDHHRAIVIGERTWGKGSVQNVISLEDRLSPSEASRPGRDSAGALKLTIAGYRRPSGKNIDKTSGAKEGDAWGVSPDAGFEVKLSEDERVALMADRSRRDLVAPKKPGASAPKSEPATSPPKTESPKSGTVKSAPKSEPPKSEPPKQAGPPGPTQPSGEPPKAPPVDRQLQKAIEYLTTELARAK
jgi:carboxyl-terminal processing protease